MMAAMSGPESGGATPVEYLIEAKNERKLYHSSRIRVDVPHSCRLPYPREMRVCQWACEEASGRAKKVERIEEPTGKSGQTALARNELFAPTHLSMTPNGLQILQ
jgi:hypothetical protein